MDKHRQQKLILRYFAFFAFCVVLLLVGVIVNIPIDLTVNGAKLPSNFALIFSLSLLALSVIMGFSSYQCWFQEKKARTNLEKYLELLRSYSLVARLPIYNPTILLWYYRVVTLVACILFFGLFVLVTLGTF